MSRLQYEPVEGVLPVQAEQDEHGVHVVVAMPEPELYRHRGLPVVWVDGVVGFVVNVVIVGIYNYCSKRAFKADRPVIPPRARFEFCDARFEITLIDRQSGKVTEHAGAWDDFTIARLNRYIKGLWVEIRGQEPMRLLADLPDETLVKLEAALAPLVGRLERKQIDRKGAANGLAKASGPETDT